MDGDITHFSMVGFDIHLQSQADFVAVASNYLKTCSPLELSGVDIICTITDPSGGEVRVGLKRQPSGDAGFSTLNPAFDGDGQAKVEIVASVSDPDYLPWEVRVTARFAGEETPLVFDLANPQEASRLVPGTKATIELAAFSFEPKVFADEAAFRADQQKPGQPITLAPNFFIPSGLFFESAGGVMPDGANLPVAYADFAGTVLQAERRTNKSGDGEF